MDLQNYGRSNLSLDNVPESGVVVSIQEETLRKKDEKEVHWLLEYTTCLLCWSIFSILGNLGRYGLQELFGSVSHMYPDFPANMVGSFLMGCFLEFKEDTMKISKILAIGFPTFFLGSLTTYSAWIQNVLELIVEGQWDSASVCIILGLFLMEGPISFGIETAKGLKWLTRRSNINIKSFTCVSNRFYCLVTINVMLLLILGVLWGLFGSLLKKEFDKGSSEAILSLACMVAPIGAWIRWSLARFNGRGLGGGKLKWMPVGTLAANVTAVCVMAILATVKKEVKTTTFNTLASGIQFGLLGCLSTVSTFGAEFHAMRESAHPWRAYAYLTIKLMLSLVLGTLLYSVPAVWVRGYN